MTQSNTWFTAHKEGLRKLVEHLPKEMVLFELVQNVWDENASLCKITIERDPGSAYVKIRCEDDVPQGFKHLHHAFTIWADSEKKSDPTKRGRFNEGEKKVLALCRKAEISTTTGTVVFNEDGTRTQSSKKRERGSVFYGEMRMTVEQVKEVEAAFHRLIPPGTCRTTLNGVELQQRAPKKGFEETLPTFNVDEEGRLRNTRRKTEVRIYECKPGEKATLYECGIPVVETGDVFHVSIEQKVPLNRDRDNVTPAFLRKVRAAVLVHAVDLLDEESSTNKFVDDALEDDSVDSQTISKVLDKRHGEKRAFHDHRDLEANKRLHGEGYEVIPRGAYSTSVRNRILKLGSALRSGELRPTPKPFSTDPQAPQMKKLGSDELSSGMQEVQEVAQYLARELGVCSNLRVVFGLPRNRWWAAAWGYDTLVFNVSSLGRKWFATWHERPEKLLDLLIHEFAHKGASDHLSDAYHKNATRIGARLALLMSKGIEQVPHWDKV